MQQTQAKPTIDIPKVCHEPLLHLGLPVWRSLSNIRAPIFAGLVSSNLENGKDKGNMSEVCTCHDVDLHSNGLFLSTYTRRTGLRTHRDRKSGLPRTPLSWRPTQSKATRGRGASSRQYPDDQTRASSQVGPISNKPHPQRTRNYR